MRLTREMILNHNDRVTEDVDVPEWGGVVTVAAMTGSERDAFEASLIIQGKGGGMRLENIRAKLVSMTVVDEDGKPMFTAADIAALGAKSSAALDRIFTVAQRLSKLSDKDMEDLEKN